MSMNWAAETEKQLDEVVPQSPVKPQKQNDWAVTDEQKSKLPEFPEIIEDPDNFEIPDPVIIECGNDHFHRYTWELTMDPNASKDDENPDEVLVQTVEFMKRSFVKVNKNVAERRTWAKYGMSAGDAQGPQGTTQVSADDVPIIYSNRRNIIHNQAVVLNETEEQELIDAKRNIVSQLKANKLTKEKAPQPGTWTAGTTPSSSGAPTSFMARVKDAGLSAGGAPVSQGTSALQRNMESQPSRPGRPTSQYAQEEGCTVRVTNFNENVTEGDFQDLFGSVGNVKRIYMAKDKKTQRSKGFAYVTYQSPQSAQKAIAKLHRFTMNFLILNVELSVNKDKKP